MNTTNEKMVTLEMLKNLSADLQSKRKEASNQTVAQKKVLADKPKRPYKRQTKANRVRKLLAVGGMSVHEIATKAKVSVNYVYQIRWYDNKAAGIASLKKNKVEETLGTDQIPYVQPAYNAYPNPIAAAHTPGSPKYVFTITEQAPAPRKLTLWERVRDFVGL
jgi:hypothetical protein